MAGFGSCGKLVTMNLDDTCAPPAAVFWDYDGTLVDTQPIWLQVEKDIAASYGREWTDELACSAVGISGIRAAQMLLDLVQDPDMTAEDMEHLRSSMVAERVAAEPLSFRPGADTLLDTCAENGIPCVLVSASPRFVLDAGVGRMPSRWFAATISGDEITRPKPDPQGYLLAASTLGVDPASCLVIEDSAPGCEAGRRSGAAVLAVPNMTQLEPCPGQVIRPSLEGLSVEDLGEICAQAHASLEY